MMESKFIFEKSNTLTAPNKPLRLLVKESLEHYFSQIDETLPPRYMYKMVIEEIEMSLLETTLCYTQWNQCQAAKILGISRSTLRKKLIYYDLRNTAHPLIKTHLD